MNETPQPDFDRDIFFSTVAGCPPRNPQPIVRDIGGVEGTHGVDVRLSSAGFEK